KASDAKVLALVLPKRASVLQSIVNMKLLKRSADNEKKNLVLITTETGLLPLAGAVGLHVAKTLSSAPEIPPPPSSISDSETVNEDMNVVPLETEDEETPDLTKEAGKSASVGALADAAEHKPKGDETLETLKLDNEEEKPAQGKPAKTRKNRHLKIPNFNRFRLILVLSTIVVIALIVLAVFALSVWPHAEIQIKTDATSVNTSQSLTLDPQATSANLVSGDIPGTQVSEQKTFTQTVSTTGQKNVGTNATGTVNLTAEDCPFTYGDLSFTIPAGTGISYNNLTYISQNATLMTVTGASGHCPKYTANGPTNITAQGPGTAYNTQIQNGTVANYPEVVANGSAGGGTDSFVQVVAQADIDSATSKITSNDSSAVENDLNSQLKGQNLYPIDVTFAAGTPQVTSSPSVGDQSSSVTVTEIITFTMFGAKQSDINAIVDANISSQTTKNQNIISTGVNESAFKQTGTSGTTDQVSLATTAIVGPNISSAQIKQETKGKSANAAIAAIKQNPDITSVTIKLSPFWVTSVPGTTSKITVNIAKPSVTSH
ncbi:MAG: hypothetical protein ACREF7_00590, partial [Candidatus Saccharimonadales bacterium]